MKKLISIACSLLISAIQLFSQERKADYIEAYGLYYSGLFKESITAFNKIESDNKTIDPDDRLVLGISEFKTGNLPDAIKDLQISEENGITEANLWIARINASNKNLKDALFYIERYLKTSKSPDIEIIKKDSLFKFLQDTRAWFDLMQNDWNSENRKITNEADFFAGKNDFENAHKVIESKISNAVSKAELYSYNSSLYNKEGNSRLALNEIDQALKLDPENDSFLKKKAAYLQQLSENSQAVIELNKVIEKNPADFEARFSRAKAALAGGENDLARDDIDIYVKYFNTNDALFLAGQIYYASEKYLEALKFFNRLMKDSKPDPRYFKARGMTYYQSGTYQLASYDLSMSLDLVPGDAETNLFMGLAEYYKGNDNLACYYWKRARDYGELKAIDYLQKYCKGQ
jgi:tetratricopeptide (TPR) repeat protein